MPTKYGNEKYACSALAVSLMTLGWLAQDGDDSPCTAGFACFTARIGGTEEAYRSGCSSIL